MSTPPSDDRPASSGPPSSEPPSSEPYDHVQGEPLARVGDITVLTVSDVNPVGVFLDIGLAKELLLPHSELHHEVRVGQEVVVVVCEDAQGRPYATNKVTPHLSRDKGDLRVGQQVELLVYGRNERGFHCVVDGRHHGMLFHDRTHQVVHVCDTLQGYVAAISSDGKLDLSLRKPGGDRFGDDQAMVEDYIRQRGRIDLHDKTPASVIKEELGISKKSFKRALGGLYKERKIVLEADGVRWVGAEE